MHKYLIDFLDTMWPIPSSCGTQVLRGWRGGSVNCLQLRRLIERAVKNGWIETENDISDLLSNVIQRPKMTQINPQGSCIGIRLLAEEFWLDHRGGPEHGQKFLYEFSCRVDPHAIRWNQYTLDHMAKETPEVTLPVDGTKPDDVPFRTIDRV